MIPHRELNKREKKAGKAIQRENQALNKIARALLLCQGGNPQESIEVKDLLGQSLKRPLAELGENELKTIRDKVTLMPPSLDSKGFVEPDNIFPETIKEMAEEELDRREREGSKHNPKIIKEVREKKLVFNKQEQSIIIPLPEKDGKGKTNDNLMKQEEVPAKEESKEIKNESRVNNQEKPIIIPLPEKDDKEIINDNLVKQPEKVISDQEDDITEYQFKFFTTQRYKAKYEKIYENLLALMKDQGITISQKPIDVADFWTVYFAWWNYSDKAADIKKVTSQLLLNSLYSIKTYTVNNQTLWLKVTNSTRKMDIIWPNALRVMARFECNTYGTRLKGDNNFAPEALKKYADFVYEGTEVSNRVKYFKNVLIKRKEDQGIIDRLEEKYTMIDDFIYFFSDHPNREDMDYMVPRLIQYLKGEMIDIRPDN